MSQIIQYVTGGGGGGTVVMVSGAHGINITGDPAVNPTVNINNAIFLGDLVDITGMSSITLTTGDITISSGRINLPTTTADGLEGIITVNGTPWIQSFGESNVFIGNNAGNLTLSGGRRNIALGDEALGAITSGDENIAIGYHAGTSIESAFGNVAIGSDAVMSSNVSSNNNVAIGDGALLLLQSGSGSNICIGDLTCNSIVSGQQNVAIGAGAGQSLTGTDSSNIILGNNPGLAGDNNTIRIGTLGTHTSCFVAGIAGVTVANTAFVTIDTTTGEMGSSAGSSGIGQINGDVSFVAAPTVTFTGGTSGAVFTGNGTTTMTESFNFLELPNANAGATQGYISFNSVLYAHNGGATNNSFFLGPNNGNFTAAAGNNYSLGTGCLTAIDTGQLNIALGVGGLASVTSGGANVAIGPSSVSAIDAGSFNIGIGYTAGASWTSADSSNISIGNPGVSGDVNTIRIGTQGSSPTQQDSCFIAGIAGVTTTNSQMVTIDTTTGELGSAPIASGLTWQVITVDQAADVNNGYICNKAGLLTLTLPATSSVGDIIEVTGMNTNVGWRIAQGSGQTIHFGAINTTTGAGGYLESTLIYDSIRIVCNIANLDWIVLPGTQGNITVA